MSNAGQAILGIVGGIVGFYLGGPTGAAYGFQLGYLAGTALFPTQLPHVQGPRLGEGQQTQSTVGSPIPMIFGTQPVGGNIIWASPVREIATTTSAGGKGGAEQSQTTYSYRRSFAILLCEGPIGGVRAIWANGKPILYLKNNTGMSFDEMLSAYGTDTPEGRVVEDFLNQQAAGASWLERMTIYLGTEDQLPDPVIESFQGVGNVPAYRGYAYVVFDDVLLRPEDGNRLPASWKFEVYEEGNEDSEAFDYYANEVMLPWHPGYLARPDPRQTAGAYKYRVNGIQYDDPQEAISHLTTNEELIGWSAGLFNNEFVIPLTADIGSFNPKDDRTLWMLFPAREYSELNPVFSDAYSACSAATEGGTYWVGSTFRPHGIYAITAGPHPGPNDGVFNCGTYWAAYFADQRIEVERQPQPPQPPCVVGVPSGVDGRCVAGGRLFPSYQWEYMEGTYRSLQGLTYLGGDYIATYPLSPVRHVSNPQYDDEDFWTAAYERARARGDMADGLVYGVHYPYNQPFAYRIPNPVRTVDTFPVSLAEIIRKVCARVNMTAIDVEDLEDVFVIGYQVSRPMYARAAIEPLRSVGFFDVVESGEVLKFTKRGKAIVDTLTDDDLGAHVVGEDRPALISTRKAQEVELPRQVRVHFMNPLLDYDPGEELSPSRFDTQAESVLDVDLAVCLESDDAAKIAETLMRDFWVGRWSHSVQVDQTKAALEAADPIAAPVDGQVHRMRINSITDRLPNLRTFELVRDDDGTYVSHAVGTGTSRPPVRIPFYGPVDLLLMDLPALTDADNDAGYYAASKPLLTNGDFRGALFLKSPDSGGTFSIVGSVTTPVAAGEIVGTPPGIGPTTIFDEGGEITVDLEYGEMESRTEADVLNGANAAAIGAHGRWEIVQFKNATNVIGSIWTVSGLLRGRRGTEHNVGATIKGDRFVMLSTGDITRINSDIASIGKTVYFKSIPIGTSPEGAAVSEFEGEGMALKPFSPVHIAADREVDGSISLSWVRRDRLGSDTVIPMSESSIDFEIDVMDAEGLIVRTISVSETSATYSADQQVTDFGALQDSVTVRIYQISTTVGRGTGAEATV